MSALTGELEHLSGQVFQNSRGVHCCLGTYADIMLCFLLEVTVDTTNREL